MIFVKKFHFSIMTTLVMLTNACSDKPINRMPIKIAETVVDKVISETSFKFDVVRQKPVQNIQVLNFRQNFEMSASGMGYALGNMMSEKPQIVQLGLSYCEGVKIWVNDEVIYQKVGGEKAEISEIAYDMFKFQDTILVNLKSGNNKILIKSISQKAEWKVILKPIVKVGEESKNIHFTSYPDFSQTGASSWLYIGPFLSPADKNKTEGVNTVYPPEQKVEHYYKYKDQIFIWQVPKRNTVLKLHISAENSYKRDSYLDWHYANGSTMFSIYSLGKLSDNNKYDAFVQKYCDFIVRHYDLFQQQYYKFNAFRGSYHRLFRKTMLDDSGAPALPFLDLYLMTHKPEYEKIFQPMANYIRAEQVRLPDGTFCRPEPVSMTVWADDLFMSVPFLLRMGKISGNGTYFDDAITQIKNFNKYLFSKNSELYYHGWFDSLKKNSPAFWGRANGWVMWAVSEALLYLPENHADYNKVIEIYRQHAEGLVKYQDESGMWHQVLNHPDSYEETSCTAMFVLGLARGVHNGWIDSKYRKATLKGWNALSRKIDSDGTVHGICRGTGIGNDFEFYYNRATFDHDPRGLGAVITAALEISKLKYLNN